MKNRREFLIQGLELITISSFFGLVGCGKKVESKYRQLSLISGDRAERIVMYDTYAMALYMDGSLGPKTGIIKVDYILKNLELTLDFWHGHGGKQHRYTLTPEHFTELKKGKKIFITTTVVDSHSHRLFIDPKDPKWRVEGALPVNVPDPSF